MGKFAISCPSCGSYVTAYNGLRGLIHNQITCENCNHTIDVKSNRMINVVCPNCKNSVMYDQGKKVPKCPVCNHEIAPAAGKKMIQIHCPTCHASYSMAEGTSEYTCSLCDSVIDVQKELAAIGANSGATSLVEYDPGNRDWLVYKHPIKNFANGSQLIVRPGQQALLVEAGRDSHLYESGTYTLDTENFPYMEKGYKLSNGDTRASFQSSIYFFNLRMITEAGGRPLQWFVKKTPVPFVMSFEGSSRATEVMYNVGCGGTYDIHITDARKLFLNLNIVSAGLSADSLTESKYSDVASTLSKSIKGKINAWGGEILAQTFRELKIDIFRLDESRSRIAGLVREKVNQYLAEFGLEVESFLVDSYATPENDKDDPGYKDFMDMRTMASRAVVKQKEQIHEQDIEEQRRLTQRQKMQTDAESLEFERTEQKRGLIRAEAEAEKIRMIAAAKADEIKMQAEAHAHGLKIAGGDYEKETQRIVGKAAMENAMMGSGENGSGLGEIVGTATALGVMGKVMEMTREAINPADTAKKVEQETVKIEQNGIGWDCECGQRGIFSNFCPACGKAKRKPEDSWNCPVCGQKGNISRFCSGCGTAKPEPWNCTGCGRTGNTTKFCPECGMARPEKWDCTNCGRKGNTTKFCPDCGKPKKSVDKVTGWNCSCGQGNIMTRFCPACGQARPENEE